MFHVPNPILPGHQPEPRNIAKSILVPFGEYFQIQDDSSTFPSRLSRSSRSARISWIKKCSWCVNTALELCMPEHGKVLDENYERKDSECERSVKEAFETFEVDMRMTDRVNKERVYRELVTMIGEMPQVAGKGTLMGEVFKRFVARP
ncbi:hypothetical protein IW262DRAFT_1413080, partial [Armillaria fumosa]